MLDGLLVGVNVGLQVPEAVADGVGLAVNVPLGLNVGVMVGVAPVMPPADFTFKIRSNKKNMMGRGEGGWMHDTPTPYQTPEVGSAWQKH